MKVLIVNRKDAYEKLGGDTIQMDKTKEELVKKGIECKIALGTQSIDEYKKYDIIHLFNIQTEDFTYEEALKVKKANKKLVVSPIWWDYERLMNDLPDECYTAKARLIKKIFGKRILISMKSINQKKRNIKRIKILTMSDLILPNSSLEVIELQNSFKIDFSLKCKVVYNGICESFLDNQKIEFSSELKERGFLENNYITQVGRIEIGKNTLLTIKACSELGIPLVVIGEFTNEKYKKLCLEMAKDKKVYFMGKRSQKEIVKINKFAKGHVLPSYRETPGLASLEAAAVGCNILSTKIGSAEEYFGSNAYYCNPNSYESIYNGIKNVWNTNKNETLIKVISEKYTWKIAASDTKEGYKLVNEEK